MINAIIIGDELNSFHNFFSNIIDCTDFSTCMFKDDPLKYLEYVKNNNVEVAFLDMKTPKISGEDLGKELIKINPKLKLVYISGYINNQEKLKKAFCDNLGAILNKSFSSDELKAVLNKLTANKNHCFLKTFGSFDLLTNSKPIRFLSAKSKKLLALLVDKNGCSVAMDKVICALLPDLSLEKSQILYRDAIWKFKKILKENNFENLVTFHLALTFINKIIPCDYWIFLDVYKGDYQGEYLISYD